MELNGRGVGRARHSRMQVDGGWTWKFDEDLPSTICYWTSRWRSLLLCGRCAGVWVKCLYQLLKDASHFAFLLANFLKIVSPIPNKAQALTNVHF